MRIYEADPGGWICSTPTGTMTCAAAYAVRPKPGAPVSARCTWDEVRQGTATPAGLRRRLAGTALGQ